MNVKNILTALLVLVLFIVSGYLFIQEQAFIDSAETATATHVTYRWSPSGENGADTACRVWEFTTNTGQTIQFEDNTYCATDPPGEIGEQLTVYYDPANPDKHRLDTLTSKYLYTLIAASLGGLILILSLVSASMNVLNENIRERVSSRTAQGPEPD